MAKKQVTKSVAVEETAVEQEIMETVNDFMEVEIPRERLKPSNEWEIKDRIYYLKGEMVGDQRLEHIIFRSGSLFVPREQTVLQKLLSLYHPHRDSLYEEHKPAALAADEIDILNIQVDALIAARNIDIDMAEAIMRVERGSDVSNLSSKELKRDLLVFARNNPKLFLELADDENVMLRNFGIKAVESGVLRLSSDQRNFMWGSNGRKLMTIPFDEHPYTALAHWFKTDEGMEIYSNIEKRLNN